MTLLWAGLTSIASSIWQGVVLSGWLYTLTGGSNTKVGIVEASSGIVGLAAAFPVGYCADRYGRTPVVRFGSAVTIVAIAATVCAILYDNLSTPSMQYYAMLGALAVWGLSGEIMNGPLQALFAESVPRKLSSMWFTRLQTAFLVPMAVGPLCSMALFVLWGDTWSIANTQSVILVGLALEVPVAIVVLFVSDSARLDEHLKDSEDATESEPLVSTRGSTNLGNVDHRCSMRDGSVPYVLFASEFIVMLGSGATVNFFPLFFRRDLSMTPSSVQGIYAAMPLCIAALGIACHRLGTWLGRVQSIIVFSLLGLMCLVTMSWMVLTGETRWYVIVPLFLVRAALMNAPSSIRESIMMDYVTTETRARWKSLDAVTTFGWTGSAAIGGVLADNYGYPSTFLLTAAVQAFGVLILIPLVYTVPRVAPPPEAA